MGTPELIGCQALPSVGFSKNARILEQLARSFSKDLPDTHSSILAWRIPGMGEPGGLPHGHPSPAGRPRSAWPAGWEQERDKEGQPLGHWTPTTGAHPSDPREEAESSLLMLPPSGMP